MCVFFSRLVRLFIIDSQIKSEAIVLVSVLPEYNPEYNSVLPFTIVLKIFVVDMLKYGIDSVKSFRKNLIIITKFELKQTTKDIVLKLLKNIDISKAAGINNLPGRFLKYGAVVLEKPVTKICTLSIKLRIFPDPCKLAKLKPIFEKGSSMEPSNYRPISLLPLISKIFEKIVHDQMLVFLS